MLSKNANKFLCLRISPNQYVYAHVLFYPFPWPLLQCIVALLLHVQTILEWLLALTILLMYYIALCVSSTFSDRFLCGRLYVSRDLIHRESKRVNKSRYFMTFLQLFTMIRMEDA